MISYTTTTSCSRSPAAQPGLRRTKERLATLNHSTWVGKTSLVLTPDGEPVISYIGRGVGVRDLDLKVARAAIVPSP